MALYYSSILKTVRRRTPANAAYIFNNSWTANLPIAKTLKDASEGIENQNGDEF